MYRGVISFPKSGRTWLRVILDELGVEADYTHAKSDHQSGVHFSKLDTEYAARFDRIVFLRRDPRDTVVSGYHQLTKRLGKNYPGSISDFIRDPHHGIEKIIRFNRLWEAYARNHNSVFSVTYEQLLENAPERIREVVNHFDYQISAQAIQQVVERNTFERMQQREIAGAFDRKYKHGFGAPPGTGMNGLKCRKGKSGSYLEELSADDIEYCDTVMAKFEHFGSFSCDGTQSHSPSSIMTPGQPSPQ